MKQKTLFTLAIALFMAVQLQAQGFLRADNKDIVNDNGPFLIRSIGTGNWLIQEGYMMQSTDANVRTHTQFRNKLEEHMGKERTKEFYDVWLDHHFTKVELDSMKVWGFNAIRPALHSKWFTLPIEQEPVPGENTWIDRGFDLLDSLVSWAEANEMYVILDMHGTPGGQGKNEDISDYDQSLPSLWESQENQDKLVELWVKLATKYKDNPWVGGYDLINEPNWDVDETGHANGCSCQSNDPIWDLHLRLTKEIRKVDTNHIIFVSGNCWGNNYKSFDTHPINSYDNNTAITFHKYWNINKQYEIQWAIDMREKYNMPLWMSESGENSNQWFADAIHLFEANNIGWSWWPVKKHRVNNVFKIETPESYTRLIESWKEGNTPLNADETYEAAMAYANAHKIENCSVQRDVIFAMTQNHNPEATKAWKHFETGDWIQAVQYDMGRDGYAYHDEVSENIHTDTQRFFPWNNGKVCRNDGVDIGTDNKGDFYVGWTEAGEWLQYTIQVDKAKAYKLMIQSASTETTSKVNIYINNKLTIENAVLATTKENLSWKNTKLDPITLPKGEVQLRIEFVEGGSNVKAFTLK